MTKPHTMYRPTDPKVWAGRQDTDGSERFYQMVECLAADAPLPLLTDAYALIGFACDEGIRRNAGRVGAAEGSQALRRAFAGLAARKAIKMIDLGDIVCVNNALEDAQQVLGEWVAAAQKQGAKTVVLGGGHELAYGHYLGLQNQGKNLGIINFDAHFDLRKADIANSGTPFLQIAEDRQRNGLPFHYNVLGIQETANTQSLFARADALKVDYLTAETMHNKSLAWQQAYLDDWILNVDAIYLSLCLDVFASAFAPGVSAPQALGLYPEQIMPLLKSLMQTGKVIGLDIAELSPQYDLDARTSKLAAQILAHLLTI